MWYKQKKDIVQETELKYCIIKLKFNGSKVWKDKHNF